VSLGNLRQLANNSTRVVNPNVPATLYVSAGYTIGSDFVQVPGYNQASVTAQVQPLSSGDVRLLDSLNIQGANKKVFLNGTALAIDRVLKFGGDLIVFPDGTLPEGTTWKILASLEQWNTTWCMVAIILQDDVLFPSPSTGGLTTDLSDPGNEVIVPAILTGV
jgi:hypothetical protein